MPYRGQGFYLCFIKLTLQSQKTSDRIAKVAGCLNGCIADIAETATDVAVKYGTANLQRFLFEVPFVPVSLHKSEIPHV